MTTNEISTKSNGKGIVELSIPRIPGVRSEMVARITANPETFDCTLTRLRRDADGQESVLSGKNCKAYFRPERAMRAAKKFLEAELADNMENPTETSLAKKQTIAELVGIYDRATEDIRKAFALIDAAELAINEAFSDGSDRESSYRSISVQGRYNHCRPDWEKPEETLKSIDRAVWERLIDRMEVKRLMSVKAAEALDKQLSNDELPSISLQAIEAMATGFQMQAPGFLEAAVKEVFEFLRPPSHGRTPKYKRNSEFEIPKRVVLEWMVEGSSRGLRILYGYNGDRDQYLVALENVLNSLDGKGSIGKTHRSAISNAMVEQGAHGETELFKYDAYCNRNLHLSFKRLDLLAKLNQLAGGKRLHGERKATH